MSTGAFHLLASAWFACFFSWWFAKAPTVQLHCSNGEAPLRIEGPAVADEGGSNYGLWFLVLRQFSLICHLIHVRVGAFAASSGAPKSIRNELELLQAGTTGNRLTYCHSHGTGDEWLGRFWTLIVDTHLLVGVAAQTG